MLRGLRTQILLWTILPLAVVLVGVAYLGVNSHQMSMREMVSERDGVLARVAAAQLSQLFTDHVEHLDELAREQPPNWNAEAFDAGAALFDSQRGILAAEPDRAAWLPRIQHLPTDTSFSEPFLENGVWRVMVARPVGQNLLVGAFSLPPLASFTGRGSAFLVNTRGIIIAHSLSDQLGLDLSQHQGIAEVMQGQAGATFHNGTDGVEFVIGYAPVQPTGWGLLIDEPWEQVVAPMFQYSVLLPVALLLIAIVALGTIYFGARNVVQPLEKLAQVANRIAFGDYQAADKPVGGIQEIEALRATLDGMAHQVSAGQQAMQDYITAITRGQEDERKRLARELHDDTIQSLIALQQRVEMTQKALSRDPALAVVRLGELKQLIGDTLVSVRGFVRDLRPTYLEELGLIPAIETLARESHARVDIHGEEQRLDVERELILFRIVQEALRNVNKHAHATEVSVNLEFAPDEVTATIQDDGQGFHAPEAPNAYAQAGHFGLMGMQERAQLFGGSVFVKSEPGKGTKVIAYLPLSR